MGEVSDALQIGKSGIKVCVKDCPDKMIMTLDDLKELYDEKGINLCRYDVNVSALHEESSDLEYCPKLPVLPQ